MVDIQRKGEDSSTFLAESITLLSKEGERIFEKD